MYTLGHKTALAGLTNFSVYTNRVEKGIKWVNNAATIFSETALMNAQGKPPEPAARKYDNSFKA